MTTYQPLIMSPLHKFLEKSSECIYIKSSQGELVFSNHVFNDLFRIDLSSGLFDSLENNKIKSDTESKVLANGSPISGVEVIVSDIENNQRFFSLDCMPWENENDEVLGTISVFRETTESKQKEQALAESTNLLNAVLDHLPVRVFWKDKDLTYLGCNTVFANDMGFDTPQQLIGQNDYVTSMTHEEADMCRADDFQVLESGVGAYGSEEVQGTGEDRTWLRVSKVPLNDSMGNMIGVLGMYEFITEEKEAQIDLENAFRREKELNELKTKFITTVTHEYRNPLTIIKTATQTLRRLGDRLSHSMLEQRLNNIESQIDRMTLLMEDVLFIGREELLESPQKFNALNIVQILDAFIDSLPTEDANRITIQLEGNQLPIIGSKIYLEQILNNLLLNALKYSDDEIHVSLSWVNDDFALKVQDSGVGIPEIDHPYIFDSFFRSNNVDLISGTGLGLYIVKRAVEIHKGAITFNSTAEQGSTFEVRLPVRARS
ncbi:MAG: ATP-binding protein [Anaerolineae bacterium]